MSSSILHLLEQGQSAHQLGQLAEAEQYYIQVLQQEPQHFDALHLIGAIAHQRGDHETALQFYGKALQRNPHHAPLLHNIGSCLLRLERLHEALQALEQAQRLDPQHVQSWISSGVVLRQLQDYPAAIKAFERAMEIQIDAIDAYYERGLCLQELDLDLDALLDFDDALHFLKRADKAPAQCQFARGLSLQKLGRFEEARSAYQAAAFEFTLQTKALFNLAILETTCQHYDAALNCLEDLLFIDAQSLQAHLQKIQVLKLMGHLDEAVAAIHKAAQFGLESEHAQFLLASLGRSASPHAAPADYVRSLFDHYAPHFDQHLTVNLEYRLPSILRACFQKYLARSAANFTANSRMLDLGCGTGLCGAELRDFGATLIGVDLSPEMLKRAAARNIYDSLVCNDIVHFLVGEEQVADLVLLADVLVYMGDLQELLTQCHRVLQSDGFLFFTVELDPATNSIAQTEGYRLQASQRYAHQESYLRDLAASGAWEVLEMSPHALRREGQDVIDSLVCVWRKI
ncbi:tetratricopeptide repeat protein [Undibacterium cyanobacteriorum]|uniref:Tetratricopeptide repeat protein n=1 Tax=Undibacterium cyanobacteriorum TaxID=3073561 RepID=A0ABY9RI10_9BURK|nr:tetratricopeptide repeat protein [Undibacterium sp. 20NA77.5]WMW80843.1 tetratricopeptide repeat protein [Undibacterium sp. 20NA77.5]